MWLRFAVIVLFAITLLSGCERGQNKADSSQQQVAIQNDPVTQAKSNYQEHPNFDNLVSLGMALHSEGRHQEAANVYLETTRLFPRSPVGFNNLCYELGEIGKFDDGIQACLHALELQPNWTLAKNNLAYVRSLAEAASKKKVTSSNPKPNTK